MKYHCENAREIKQKAIIRETQLMENCSSCYLEERVKTLLTPWVTKSFPWDQSSESLSEVVSGTKENLPCSSKSTESDYDTKSQFTCHHSTSPQNPMSLYNRNSYSHSRPCNHSYYRLCRVCNNSNFIASFLACRHCNGYDCYCQCSLCGCPYPESRCGHLQKLH